MNVQIDPNELLRAKYEKNYNSGRSNLLLVIIFTVVSMATFYFNGTYFLFSAFVPLLVFSVFSVFSFIASGTYDLAELDVEYDAEVMAFFEEIGAGTWIVIGIVIALIMLSAYFLCWLLSKKYSAALVVATVFFSIDCLVILLNFDLTAILDLLFHAWVMYYLINAIVSKSKLNKLPPPVVETSFTDVNEPFTVEAWAMNNDYTDNNSSEPNE